MKTSNNATEYEMSSEERRRLLAGWNDTKTEYPSGNRIDQLFEQQVDRNPDAIAVKFDEQYLSYRELNARANQLAHYLKTLGVGPDGLVGLCMERSLELVIGILGILKAGGAYVPLDPSYPRDRLGFMLSDTQADVLLTEQRLIEALPPHNARVVCLDRDWEAIGNASQDNLDHTSRADNLAYVIYTSGSTGKPKGVLVTHYNVTRLLQGTQSWFNFDQNDTWTLFHSYAFDFSVWEIWGALAYGGTLLVVPYLVSRSPQLFLELLTNEKVTILNQTPSAFRQLVLAEQEQTSSQGLALRLIIFGGEALNFQILKPWFERHGDQVPRLVNMYGITETTVHATYRPVTEADLRYGSRSLIGICVPDLELYVLDPNRNLIPIGEPGELCVGGAGLARGYLNRPELTAEKFIDNPFSSRPGTRLYRSGDLARFLPDGDIEYLGRIDDQVKIRGHRIELGEIETVLVQHPKVRDAVVLAREDNPGDRRLIAYVVSTHQPGLTITELRGYLKDRLPEYMLPSAFVMLVKLPLTLNGKVDRKALPAPDQTRPEFEENYVAPRTATEERVAKIWIEVLGFDPIGIHDDFFALGGHSIRAIQIIARLRTILNREVFLNDIFSNPTIAELASILDNRTAEAEALSTDPIQPIGRNRSLPLAFSQERAWFIQQLHPSNLAYLSQSLLYFTGCLDIDALEQSLSEIVRRHEIYRTTFPEIDGNPIQDIHTPFSVSLSVADLQELPDHDREAALQELITAEIQKPFDLNKLPLVRWTLVQLKFDEFVLIHVEHHLVHDGWSFNVFRHELLELYKAFSTGDVSPLPEATLQFADFAHWQRQWMKGEIAKRQLAYWKRQLTGSPSTLALATDHPRPPIPSLRGAAPRFDISPALGESLRAFSRQQGVTLFMTMFSAFVALLYRYTQQDDICVGTGVGNRRWKESEGLIGMLVNNVVLRTKLTEDPRFVDLLAQVRAVTLDAFANEDIPFDHVVRALEIERDDSRNPIFQVMFSFHDAPLHEPTLPGISFKCVEAISNRSAKFDLNVIVIPRSEQSFAGRAGESVITLVWEYSSDLFDPTTIERMIGHFQTLLEGIVSNPEQAISELPLLTEGEKHQLLVNWNDTKTDYPKDKCLHELFETQVEKTPDAIAVVFEDQQLSYRELNTRANQLAHYLHKLGVGPAVLVGICVERSIEMIIGLLGILKAGGAYVPLDPAYPKDRREFILSDSQVSVLLTKGGFAEQSGSKRDKANPRSVVLDRDRLVIDQESRENLTAHVQPSDLAYVIYTSGSTGTPKGVAIEHRNTGAFLSWVQSAFTQDELSGVLASTSICFDLSVFEIFAPLTSGGTVIVAQNALALTTLPKKSTVTLLNTVPSAMNELLNLVAIPESVRVINLAGEPLQTDLVRRIYESSSVRKVHDLYGPSECTTYSTWTCRTPEGRQTIGRPIANTQVYILDGSLNPVPIGVVGEIYIGGDGVARGYLNRPELTEEKFIPDPFSEESGARLYKTGDRARYLPDGNIEFLGRMDHQVKMRGFRIELGEIEAVLGQHRAVQSSVVVAREDVSGDKRLVGYVVAAAGNTPSVDALRGFLQQKLPEYMVPSAFMFLDSLPITPNGKLDRKALPAPDQTRPDLDETFVAPRTPVEETLASIWAAVLKVDKVGIHDNFFELGGHSLLATQLISRIRDTFKIELPLRSLFEAPTIYGLAQRMQELGVKQDVMQETKITRLTREQYRV